MIVPNLVHVMILWNPNVGLILCQMHTALKYERLSIAIPTLHFIDTHWMVPPYSAVHVP